MDIIRAIEQQQIKQDVPEFNVGDNVKVHYRITEGNRERIQVFQGDVIRRPGRFESRDVHRSQDQLLHRRGAHLPRALPEDSSASRSCVRASVRRAKLYYLRKKVGKAAKIKEKAYR